MANVTHAIAAVAGIVTSQAVAIVAPRPQLTAESFRVTPTPITDPVITWVVLTGRPISVAPWITLAPINWAVRPVAGSNLIMLQPRVRMIRQPPAYVPKAMVTADRTTTHRGTWNLVRSPDAIKASVIAAMVFCASFAPCEYERKAAVRTCSLRNVRLTGVGRRCKRCTTRISRIAKTAEAMKPSGGETTRLAICLPNAAHFTPPRPPAAAMPAPQRPPMSAWVELLGSPRYQVIRFHEIAPIRAAITTTSPGLMASVLAMVLETFAWKKATVTTAPTRLNKAESPTAT